MAHKPKVKMTFIKDSIPNKLLLGRHVYDKMQSAGIYSSPPVSYADMLLIQTDLGKKAVGEHGGTVLQYLLQEEAEKNWDDMMRKQAKYVNFVADGDGVKLEKSGFPITATERKRWQIPHQQQQPLITFNNKLGGVDIKTPKTLYATAFNYLLVTDPKTVVYHSGKVKIMDGNKEVIHICATQRKINLKSLTKGMNYFVFVYPVGPAGMGSFAPYVSFIYPGYGD
jgi:hypothetical protein